MDQFPGNSHTDRKAEETKRTTAKPLSEDEKRENPHLIVLDPVVTGKVVRRKKSVFQKITETLVKGESSVFGYLLNEVLVPALKEMAATMVTQGIEKTLYGEVRSPRHGGHYGTTRGGYQQTTRPYVTYNQPGNIRPSVSNQGPSGRPQPMQRSSATVGDVVVGTKLEAQNIIDQLYQIVDRYGQATVGHLNNLLGEPMQYTDHDFGWTNLDQLTARRVSAGFLIMLPPVEPLR